MLSCKFGQRMVLTRNGSVVYCKECRKCLPGFGLNPPCFNSGITVEPVTEACQRCVLGTFSSGTDSSRCKPCGRCPAHVLVKKNCTPLHKTECTMECEKPYYYSNGYCIKCCPCIQGAQNDLRCIGFGSLVSKAVIFFYRLVKFHVCKYSRTEPCFNRTPRLSELFSNPPEFRIFSLRNSYTLIRIN